MLVPKMLKSLIGIANWNIATLQYDEPQAGFDDFLELSFAKKGGKVWIFL
jgi:hypothetical protein